MALEIHSVTRLRLYQTHPGSAPVLELPAFEFLSQLILVEVFPQRLEERK
ncbi:hypothetical protein VCRA2113O118_50181 [Vibrio crassostreae]|uniref:Uncharacterized protein n=1 Tax=Vibrio crassostreae TaxID=246167 RepID=A0A822MTB6_9VIBR|nr:hypothetical protein VCRA2119O381_120041 [Vibrio crassostreae]CAK1875377.1 hypothetical protein VCRA2117O379_10317 [Vibrio crassostreae]CAK1876879.1 hypothetical protein VCRA2119O382_10336 [Vibrio crassostreae]CAK1878414.1 hypothetical protein VCRA2117O380_10336 [Vibrio crassostreae]CAK1902677.1 hypothetical protein VCRA2113O120_220070 [Vibrio crassostreae]